jgi:Uma2 family endonuclease
MNQPAVKGRLTVEDYLAGEKDGEMRHEYLDGKVYAMTGASRRHGLITGALYASLRPKARVHGCQLFSNDMKVRIELHGKTFFYYPDLVLACDPDDREDDYYLTRPCLIIKVLSETTERTDRREKLLSYVALPSLKEYILVPQQKRMIECYRRVNDWLPEEHEAGEFTVDCLDARISVEAVYEDVEPFGAGQSAP